MTTYRYDDLRPKLGAVKNGVKTPNRDHVAVLCWDAWDHFARCYGQGVTTTKDILEHDGAKRLNKGNLRTELSQFRKFHGID